MKVIYKTSMVDRLIAEIYEAKSINKEVDKIILTPDEWLDLKKELTLCHYTATYSPDDLYGMGGAVAKFMGVPIFVE